MHFPTTAIIATLIGLAMSEPAPAAAAPSAVAKCAAQSILDACLDSMKPQMEKCYTNDWKCLCEQSNNVLTCYNNCPDHPDRFGISQESQSYCNADKANSLLYSSTATTAPKPSKTGDSSSSTGSSGSGSGSGTGPAGTDANATGSASASPAVSLGAAPAIDLASVEGVVLMAMGWILAF